MLMSNCGDPAARDDSDVSNTVDPQRLVVISVSAQFMPIFVKCYGKFISTCGLLLYSVNDADGIVSRCV